MITFLAEEIKLAIFEPIGELELEKVFIKIIDTLAEKDPGGSMVVSDIGEILFKLTKEHPKESLFLLSEMAKYCKKSKTREYAIDLLSEIAFESIKPTEKPEEPEISEICHGEKGTT
jgi:hypothetical protein